ncbi:MAG: caspase family protein [Candidatus Protistobacter heckmanni]|nr:caspase family protein [Candidatus Protistobacter heckmanni]
MKPFPSSKTAGRMLGAAFLGAALLSPAAWAADPPPPAKKPASPSAVQMLSMDSGRDSHDLVVTTGIRGFKKPASESMHALIMIAGAYQNGIPQLKGVYEDAKTASEIAERMGVPKENLTVLSNVQLTLEGMRKAFTDLAARVRPGDDVFIYYSGHGGRQLIQDDSGERCAESLVTIDGYGYLDKEMSAQLKVLSLNAKKVVVFVDSCHSGGVITRAIGSKAPAGWVPKSGRAGDVCSVPTNVVKRSLTAGQGVPGSSAANFVYVAAVRDDEISFDQPGLGGIATQAWLACMRGHVKDADGSGGISAEELASCAQERINQALANADGLKPHHVTMNGNRNLVLTYMEKDAPAPASAPAAAAAAAPAPKLSPAATLKDIYENLDDRRQVLMSAAKSQMKINADALDLTVESREGGYVYLLMVGSDGETFDILFPNQIDANNRIAPGEKLRLPRRSGKVTAGGPVGTDTVLAMVTDAPRDFTSLGLAKAGPFSVVQANAVAAKDILLVSTSALAAASKECKDMRTRNLVVDKSCSNSYGAAILSINEVR